MGNTVTLKKICELDNYSFIIPDFQRGYKWTKRQVFDLLDDLKEFMNDTGEKNCYCLQPLVVKNDDGKWSVIDGQQRLTTTFLLQCYLGGKNLYNIKYQTRKDSEEFLQYFREYNAHKADIDKKKEANVDYFHITNAYSYFEEWFKQNQGTNKTDLLEIIRNRTQFIWYECNEENVVEVFTRVNIGKISLTSAELIKAVMLNQSNWKNNGALEAEQYHIAEEWNQMEITLQNDEFWFFICNKNDKYSTRIELLFDIICQLNIFYNQNKLNPSNRNNSSRIIGDDQYKTFRYFYNYFKSINSEDARITAWKAVKKIFQVLNEWYKDVECYHYIGYLIECKPNGVNITSLYKQWCEKEYKEDFKNNLKTHICNLLKTCNKQKNGNILEQQYEIGDNAPKKTVCRPILLLHNIQLTIKQNKKDEKDIFQENVFYRFPFYLLKNQSWDVEHVDSNTTNNLSDNYARLLWLLQYEQETWLSQATKNKLDKLISDIKKHLTSDKSSDADNTTEHFSEENLQDDFEDSEEDDETVIELAGVSEADVIENALIEEVSDTKTDENEIRDKMKFFPFEQEIDGVKNNRFDDLVSDIENEAEAEAQAEKTNRLDRMQKNQIGNFTLLDSKTNRSYGNSIFPRKRRTIMARDQGKEYQLILNENGKFGFIMKNSDKSAFIPPVTRNVFMKYYTDNASDFSVWTLKDAESYKADIKAMLEEFLPQQS